MTVVRNHSGIADIIEGPGPHPTDRSSPQNEEASLTHTVAVSDPEEVKLI